MKMAKLKSSTSLCTVRDEYCLETFFEPRDATLYPGIRVWSASSLILGVNVLREGGM